MKNYFSFKNKYTITSIGLIAQNKIFFHLTIGAPGGTPGAPIVKVFHTT